MKKFALSITMLLAFRSFSQNAQTELLIVGSDHLGQVYKAGALKTDVLGREGQASMKKFAKKLMHYKPDLIMVEELPEAQAEIDSMYTAYKNSDLQMLAKERSEIVQLAFRLGKALNHTKIYCANAPGGTSQGILDNGDNIELYRQEGVELRQLVVEKRAALESGKISFYDYLVFLNQPATYNKVYHLRYITPARVVNGRFKNPDAMVDTAFVNPRYIGAELTAVYKNRDYKIYSNIVQAQMKSKPKRILLIIGAAHIGSLRSIIRDDESFRLRDAAGIPGK